MNWINPILFQLGPIKIYWYGAMYAIAFLVAYLLLHKSKFGKNFPLQSEQKDNLLILVILGLLLGARIGYISFYNLPFYLENPLKILAVWEGGMSFHGGLIGAILAIYFAAKHYKLNFFKITDLTCYVAPLGLFFGRIGNFINAELYGKISTNNHFCFHFPTDPQNCRYPSQLFEALLEGLVLFLILHSQAKSDSQTNQQLNPENSKNFPGKISALFLIFYGFFRFTIEFFREPDTQIGYIAQIFTLGQIFCLIMIIAGLVLYKIQSKKRQ